MLPGSHCGYPSGDGNNNSVYQYWQRSVIGEEITRPTIMEVARRPTQNPVLSRLDATPKDITISLAKGNTTVNVKAAQYIPR